MLRNLLKLFFIFIFTTMLPLYVYADDFIDENFDVLQSIEVSTDLNKIPIINARHAIVFDRTSKQIIFGKFENEKCKMASTTKIMTAIVVLENSTLSDIVNISSKSAKTGGSRLGLSTNDTITVENLLYGLLLCSGNDAAVALAEHVGGSVENFASMMNQKASELGLNSTHFVTPHGLDKEEHYTTAYELACITDYALKNEKFSKIVKTKTYTIYLNGHSKAISNTNELLGVLNGIYGVKTGFTNGANRCLVTACKRGNLDIICVVLGCDTKKDRTQDSVKLINYTFNNFSIVNIENIIYDDFNEWLSSHSSSFTINKGVSQSLDLYLDKSDIPFSNIALNSEQIDKISTVISCKSYFDAPLQCNNVIGKLTFEIGEVEYFSVDIMNSNSIAKKSSLDYFYSLLNNFCVYFNNFYNL